MTYTKEKSTIFNLNANIVAGSIYLLTIVFGKIPYGKFLLPIIPIVIYFVEKKSDLVKFHAMQNFLLDILLLVINGVLMLIGVDGIANVMDFVSKNTGDLFTILVILTYFLIIVLFIMVIQSLIAMVFAFMNKKRKIVFIGELAEKIIK